MSLQIGAWHGATSFDPSEAFFMSVTPASMVGGAALRAADHPLLVPTLRELLPRLQARARRLAASDGDLRDELVAAGMRAVAQILETFEPDRGVPVAAVTTQQALFRMHDAFRQSRTSSRRSTLRLAEPGAAAGMGEVAPDDVLIDDKTPLDDAILDEEAVIIERAINQLPARDAQVVRHLLDGHTQADIAREYNVSRMAVSKWVARIRAQLAVSLEGQVYRSAA